MMQFEVLAGKHHSRPTKKGQPGKTYVKGDIVESENDLTEVFPNKFRKVGEYESGEKVAPAASKKLLLKRKAEAGLGPEAERAADPRGTEVTGDFKFHKGGEGVRVFSRDDLFHAYDGEETTPINNKGLDEKHLVTAVNKWLDK